jgi:phytoene dehydrogenase-like protein
VGNEVIVIGAGIAGLSAACYAQMNGYKSRIFEMHDKPGGLCTAWDRKGYTVDGCIHWLVGSAPGNGLYPMWLELGMIQGLKFVDLDQFYRYESPNGDSFTMYTNIDKLEEELKRCGPEDAALATDLCNAMRRLSRMSMPMDTAPELQSFLDKAKSMVKMAPYIKDLGKWAGQTVQDLSQRFKSQLIRESFAFWPQDFSVMGLMITVAWMHSKVAGYPIGGSMPMMRAIEKRYASMGGEIIYKARVKKVLVEHGRAAGVVLENGEEHRADYVISAADGHATIFDMLEGKYVNDTIRGYYDSIPIFTPIIFAALGVNREFKDMPQMISGITIGLPQPVTIGGLPQTRLHVRINNFDPTMAPAGKTVLACMIDSDYGYWKKLKTEPARYREEKERVAETVKAILERRFPGISRQVEMTDIATPVTFERYTGNWQGCYEGFLTTPKTQRMNLRKTLPGLDHFYMAGQWVSPGGGLPSGVMTGRYVVQMLCKNDGKKFTTSVPS